MLKIAVCAKQVPDTEIPSSQFDVDESALSVVPPSGVQPIVNGFDMNAVEVALRLRDAGLECEITVYSVGTGFVMDVMKKPLTIGADQLVLVDDPGSEELDALGTARALQGAIVGSGGADLVLCGRQASDWDQSHVPLMLGTLMGVPMVTLVRDVQLDAGGGRLTVERVISEGYQRLTAPLPALLTITNEAGEARYANMRGIMAAARKQPTVMDLAAVGVERAEPTLKLARLFVPEVESEVEMIAGEDGADSGRLLALRMREEGLI